MGKFDVQPRFVRTRQGAKGADRTTRFEAHVRAPVWCSCPFSLRRLVTCHCCRQTLCFECGGVLNLIELQEQLHELYNPVNQSDEPPPFDDALPESL